MLGSAVVFNEILNMSCIVSSIVPGTKQIMNEV